MSREYALQPFRAPVHLQIDYARELNEQQHAAVTAAPGPALVIAGAGAGKTRTLTYRVAFLLEQGIPADRILLLTFTNKAAAEMMRRVAGLLGAELSELWGGTFHSIGNRILRRHAEAIGYRRDFTILDREDARDLLKACLEEAKIDTKSARFPKPDVAGDIFSLAANTQQSIAETLALYYAHFDHLAPALDRLHAQYQERKRAANVMDFDDLLTQWLRLLRERADVRDRYQRRFQFILVDEYQDTNRIQGELIDLLAARHRNVMAVGDDSQSIYSWRGANFRNIMEFPKRHPGARICKIEVNYRSTPEILKLANAAIAANVRQFAKQLAPVRKPGPKPAMVVCGDASQQAAFVAQRVLELREEGVGMNKMAALYRSHFHALELQLELTRRNIPFRITSGLRFFEQAHVKDVAAYLKLACNPLDEVSFKRIARLLPGVGAKSADKLWSEVRSGLRVRGFESAVAGNKSPDDASLPVAGKGDDEAPPVAARAAEPRGARLPTTAVGRAMRVSDSNAPQSDRETRADRPSGSSSLASAVRSCGSVPRKASSDWAQFADTIEQLEAADVRSSPARMIEVVMEAGYEDHLKAAYPNYSNRLDDLKQLASFALQFQSTDEFLSQLALLTNLEAEGEQPGAQDEEALRLSTIHQAKGLEFDVVFVIMLCDGLFPSARSLDRPENEEEERRLFYVAVTRAKDHLYLSYPLMRLAQGCGGDVMQQPSRFLKELPEGVYDEWSLKPFHPHG